MDEDTLAEALRQRGHDVLHVREAGLGRRSDAEVFAQAVRRRRAVMTHNVGDFVRLVAGYGAAGREHFGLILAAQVRFRALLARATRLLSNRDAETLRDAVVWLTD
ncbi:MAG TPA: DUF5615 family PIN-like protein [Planctomycetota bacterium]|nr:DUF5615 family PIN-like protein [Planctomycetota bacterium]